MLNIDKTMDNILEVTVGDYDGSIEDRRIELRNDIIRAFDGEDYEIVVNLKKMDEDYMNGYISACENFYESPEFFIKIEDGEVVEVEV
ncbi:hypothetical protein [Clostridium beijerinckii]|uniref:hypothetical protein n=1 Tax=Clostridium beijerinckii TaxID=1520 RepID=UPI0022E46BDA|nr:hypothetical protein [Clostridium beijerinckii]MDU6039855.1 hypothetical protein [Clostridium butyricum]